MGVIAKRRLIAEMFHVLIRGLNEEELKEIAQVLLSATVRLEIEQQLEVETQVNKHENL